MSPSYISISLSPRLQGAPLLSTRTHARTHAHVQRPVRSGPKGGKRSKGGGKRAERQQRHATRVTRWCVAARDLVSVPHTQKARQAGKRQTPETGAQKTTRDTRDLAHTGSVSVSVWPFEADNAGERCFLMFEGPRHGLVPIDGHPSPNRPSPPSTCLCRGSPFTPVPPQNTTVSPCDLSVDR
jgi:hypothetical protein